MTVYRINKVLVLLMALICALALFFTFTILEFDYSPSAMALCFVIVVFLFFNLAILLSKKFMVEDDVIHQTTLYGKKELKLNEIVEIGVVNLRWRIILILSDPHKFVFISSLYNDFEGFVDYLKAKLPEETLKPMEKVTHKKIRHKNQFLIVMMVLACLFFIGSGIYNIIYR